VNPTSPVHTSYDFDGRVLTLHLVGEYSVTDLRGMLRVALAEVGSQPIEGLLIDLRHSASVAKRSLRDLNAITTFLAFNGPEYNDRVAIVATTDVASGLARLVGVDLGIAGLEHSEFWDVPSAMAWLTTPRPPRVL
jgi:hypothetical protein